jgi:hypothetical protein
VDCVRPNWEIPHGIYLSMEGAHEKSTWQCGQGLSVSYTLRSHSISSLTNIQATSSIEKAWNASRQTPNDYNACSIQYYIQLGSDYPCLNYTFAQCQQAICGTFDTFLLVLFDDLFARRLNQIYNSCRRQSRTDGRLATRRTQFVLLIQSPKLPI